MRAAEEIVALARRPRRPGRRAASRCQRAIEEWLDDCATAAAPRRRCCVLDYAAELDELVARGGGWLRTYRAHERGGDPLDDPGSQDITTDVLLPTLRRDARRAGFTIAHESSQAEWLRTLGIDELVAEGRRSGRPAPRAATSRRSPAGAGSPRPPRSPTPPASAPTPSSSSPSALTHPVSGVAYPPMGGSSDAEIEGRG